MLEHGCSVATPGEGRSRAISGYALTEGDIAPQMPHSILVPCGFDEAAATAAARSALALFVVQQWIVAEHDVGNPLGCVARLDDVHVHVLPR